MIAASDFIDVLIERRRLRQRLRTGHELPPGEFPPAWAAWLEQAGAGIGRVVGATADAIVAILVGRELSQPPRRVGELNRWQAFATIWRQQWTPPAREDRHVRWVAMGITVAAHLVLLVLLFWLASVHFVVTAPQGEEIVQVEYVGEGTPAEVAGGAPAGTVEKPATAPAPQPRARPTPATVASPPRPVAEQPPAATPPTPRPDENAKPAPPKPQPVQVSEVPPQVPESTFALPPPTPRTVELPQAQIREPALEVPIRDIELAKEPPPAPTPAPAPTPPTPVATTKPVSPSPPAPPVVVQSPRPQPPAVAQPQPQPVVPAAPAVPAPGKAAAPTPPATPTQSVAGAAPAATAPATAGKPAPIAGSVPDRVAAGSGQRASPKPGARPTLPRSDDWGASARNRPGAQSGAPGLFNPDGSPRLASGTAQPGGGFPPGSDHWTKDQFDRAGSWLKRPPNTFEATRFEKMWVPNETLLEEWVRKNIRTMTIPIPGTSKSVTCVVSILQLGGGCGISDPNLNDQEATARPPPDIPFKPDLQEDQQSLAKPGKP